MIDCGTCFKIALKSVTGSPMTTTAGEVAVVFLAAAGLLFVEEHRNNYNYYRPHSALAYQTPVEYATKWRSENCVLAFIGGF